ncbi:MAG: hypothetical protein DME99_03495 [Verrucomicrobia bacterium]|nr:MAG: hypothetical protein DME99_03495 [Verrucomicrobiota bacterium]
MLSMIPPLWRNVDAYFQVTLPPGSGTILQWGPLYCFVARVPLYLGYALDCVAAGPPLPTASFFIHPILTDSGVFLLLLSQHVSLCFATFYLITVATRLFWIRLTLAVLWAANPLFYTFAHCVGSETLGMILLLPVGATGLRIIRHSRRIPGKEWLLFGILLWLGILTRHINATLAGLIPLAFFLLSAHRLTLIPFARSQLLGRWRRLQARQVLQKATLAVAVGISCIVLANISLRALCHAVQIPYHSTVGFTFLFRLKFLAGLPAERRNQLLDKVAKNTDSADVKKIISLLSDAFPNETPNWDAMVFKKKVQASLFPPQRDPGEEKFYLALNRTVQAFLCPPEKIFLSAIAIDFKRSQEVTIPSVVRQLFDSTTRYFSYPEMMPDQATLLTFRDKSAARIMAIFKKHSYFHHPKNFSYSAFLFFWCVNLALLVVLAKMRKEEIAAVSSYAVALTLVGLFMMVANCVLNVFQPRYTLPMWELTIVSLSILFGETMESLFSPSRRLFSG